MINELQSSNSNNLKQEILAKYPENQGYLRIIYNPLNQFNVTSKNIKKLKGKKLVGDLVEAEDLKHLLIMLSMREVTGHAAIATVEAFINKNLEYEELILSAIDKNLKCRIEASSINKVFPNCVPTFNVALAKDYNKVSDSAKPNFEKDLWYCSRKLDGVRCICIKKGDDIRFYSRTGKEYTTLGKIRDEVATIKTDFLVFDGELCMIDEHGSEDFQGVMKEIRRKDHTIEKPMYKIFDYLHIKEFENEVSEMPLSFRLEQMKAVMGTYHGDMIQVLPQARVPSEDHLQKGLEAAAKNGWEGLMIRKDVLYEGKRSNNLLKLKKFFDNEYEVMDIVIGKMRFAYGDIEVEEDVMTKAVIKHKGFDVGVGSGWKIEERRRFKLHPEEIIGKIITVQYFEETQNQDGGLSLRFPTVKVVHGDTRED
jgi:DNA ligase-1